MSMEQSDAPGRLLASGRDADVYDIGDGRVLRRYRALNADVENEARVMRYVADRGYPVPAVHAAEGRDLVMDRIDGPTMLEAIERSPWRVAWYASRLARLQRRLAKIPAPAWLSGESDGAGRSASVLHLDLHPMNVIVSQRHGAHVIDWANAAGGPAGFDAAMTYVEVATYQVESTRDRIGLRVFANTFRRASGRRTLDAFVVAACDHRLADPNTTPDERVAVADLRRDHLSRSDASRSDGAGPFPNS